MIEIEFNFCFAIIIICFEQYYTDFKHPVFFFKVLKQIS